MRGMAKTSLERDTFGRTALHYAAADGRPDEIDRLIADGADPGDADQAGFTPLHFAAQEQHPQAVALLSGTARTWRPPTGGGTRRCGGPSSPRTARPRR